MLVRRHESLVRFQAGGLVLEVQRSECPVAARVGQDAVLAKMRHHPFGGTIERLLRFGGIDLAAVTGDRLLREAHPDPGDRGSRRPDVLRAAALHRSSRKICAGLSSGKTRTYPCDPSRSETSSRWTS